MGQIANTEIRLAAVAAGVKMWQVADCLGLHDSNFSRLLRNELPEERKSEILAIIQRLAMERSA